MSAIKVSLYIELPGSKMYSKQQCLRQVGKNKFIENPDMLDITRMSVKDGKNQKLLCISTRKCVPARKVINLSREAYDYMTSNECPYWDSAKHWSYMSREDRLKKHLSRIAESNGGKLSDYVIFKD